MGNVVIRRNLKCVSKGVAVVEDCTAPRLPLIRCDDFGFDLHTATDPSLEVRAARSSPVKSDTSPSLHCRNELLAPARLQGHRDRITRLMAAEGTDQIFSLRQVYPVFPPIAASIMPSNVVGTCTTESAVV